jgi:hypothetical protein
MEKSAQIFVSKGLGGVPQKQNSMNIAFLFIHCSIYIQQNKIYYFGNTYGYANLLFNPKVPLCNPDGSPSYTCENI